MNSAARPKVFGMDLGVDPKILVVGLVVIAATVFYFTSGSDSSESSSNGTSSSSQSVARPSAVSPVIARRPTVAARRAAAARSDRDTLKLVAVDGSRGDIDPTLRLSLLERLKNVPPAAGLRNLFEAGGTVVATDMPKVPPHPILPPKPLPGPITPQIAQAPTPPPFSIPLKYYGYVKSNPRAVDGNRGFFMDGDNILVGAEGDLLEKRFLIVALTPSMARLEDTEKKQGQDLQVTPEASAP